MTRGRRIAVIGLPYFAARTADGLRRAGFDAYHVARPGRAPSAWASLLAGLGRADAIYAIGMSSAVNSPLDILARLRKPVLMHWVGSDVVDAFAAARAGRLSDRVVRRAVHLADAPWLADELATIGVRARVVLLPVPATIGSPQPLPAEFQVLIYLPATFQTDYRVDDTMEVVRALPGVSFALVGGYAPPEAPPNLAVLGYVRDMAAVYAGASAYLRLTHHDGMAHSVVEALSYGRHVIWDHPLPGVTRIASTGEAIDAVRELARRHSAGELTENAAGAEFVRRHFNPAQILQTVQAELGRLVS